MALTSVFGKVLFRIGCGKSNSWPGLVLRVSIENAGKNSYCKSKGNYTMANCALLRDVLLWCPSCPGLLLQSIPAVSRVTLHFCLGSFKGSDVSDHFPPDCKDKDAAVTASEGLLLC